MSPPPKTDEPPSAESQNIVFFSNIHVMSPPRDLMSPRRPADPVRHRSGRSGSQIVMPVSCRALQLDFLVPHSRVGFGQLRGIAGSAAKQQRWISRIFGSMSVHARRISVLIDRLDFCLWDCSVAASYVMVLIE